MQTLIHKLNLLFNIVLNLQINTYKQQKELVLKLLVFLNLLMDILEKLQHLKLEI